MIRLFSVLALATVSGCASIQKIDLPDMDWKQHLANSKNPSDYQERISPNLYASIGIGPSFVNPNTSALPQWSVSDGIEPATQLAVGIDFNKYLAAELHTAALGSAEFSPTGSLNYQTTGISALFYAGGDRDRYRRQGYNAFARVGLGKLNNTPSGNLPYVQKNSSHVLFGAGVEYMTPMGLGLRAEGILFDEDAKYMQLALLYRTGKQKSKSRPKPKLAAAQVWDGETYTQATAALPPVQPVQAVPVQAVPVATQCTSYSGTLEGVNFHSSSDDLTDESMAVLDSVARELKSCAGVVIEVSAHTDSTGDARENLKLSQRRAQSVVDHLTTRGVDYERLKALAYGESKPIVSNDTASGRAVNRRVELNAR